MDAGCPHAEALAEQAEQGADHAKNADGQTCGEDAQKAWDQLQDQACHQQAEQDVNVTTTPGEMTAEHAQCHHQDGCHHKISSRQCQ